MLKLIKPISYGIMGAITFPFVVLGSGFKIYERYQNLVTDHIQRKIKSPKLCAILRVCWEFPATMYYANVNFWGFLNKSDKSSPGLSGLADEPDNLIIIVGIVFLPCLVFLPASLLSCMIISQIDDNAIHEMESLFDHNYWEE